MRTFKLETLTFQAHPIFAGYLMAQNDVAAFVYHREALEQLVDYEVEAETTITLGDGTVFELYQVQDEDGDTHVLAYDREHGLTTTLTNELPQIADTLEAFTTVYPTVKGTLEQYVAILAGL